MNKCGIYSITNKINNKIYIGSSSNIMYRWAKHKALLRHNKHQNSHLQNAWNKYGEDKFIFSIILECKEEQLLIEEQYYIDHLKPEYNQTMIAGKVEMTEDRKLKISNSVKNAYSENKIDNTKEVFQYDLKGNYITNFKSLKEASIVTHTDLSHLSEAVNEKINIAGGFVWRFYKKDKLNVWFNKRGRPLTKEPYKLKNIKIILSNNDEYLIFKNAKEVSINIGCTTNQVYHALYRNTLLLNKYKVERKTV